MLILTRRIGETIMIGDHATVTILSVQSNQVRLGINAPKTVEVHRECVCVVGHPAAVYDAILNEVRHHNAMLARRRHNIERE